jgi:5'-nucleotidase
LDTGSGRLLRDVREMRILISNDDGIYSPGIRALAEVASRWGDVRIVAPNVEQSSMGHAISSNRPLSYTRTIVGDFQSYRVNGTPAVCVGLGASNWEKVDLVLSGINLGLNIGNGMWHSGTLAAAKQAALLGLRGIALSAPLGEEEPDYTHIIPYLEKTLDLLLGMPKLQLVNVNFPEQPRGIRWTRQSVRHYDGKVVPGVDPMGRSHFWFTVTPIEEAEEGTDRWAIQHGEVSITPLRLDLTDYEALKKATG